MIWQYMGKMKVLDTAARSVRIELDLGLGIKETRWFPLRGFEGVGSMSYEEAKSASAWISANAGLPVRVEVYKFDGCYYVEVIGLEGSMKGLSLSDQIQLAVPA